MAESATKTAETRRLLVGNFLSLSSVQFLNGLASASSLFLVACGLSIIFGVSRIVNFAHGSFYMLGAYTAWTLVERLPYGYFGFWGSIIAAAIIVGLVGVVVDLGVGVAELHPADVVLEALDDAGVVVAAAREGRQLDRVVVEPVALGLLPPEEFDQYLRPEEMIGPK